MKTLGFHHLAVQVRDVERVATFYREVLGLAEVARHLRDDGSLRSVWLGLGPQPEAGFVAIEAAPGLTAPGDLGYSMLALRIAPEDRDRVLAELSARDVPVLKQTGWTIYFRDPEGHVVGLSHHPHPASPV